MVIHSAPSETRDGKTLVLSPNNYRLQITVIGMSLRNRAALVILQAKINLNGLCKKKINKKRANQLVNLT